MRKIKWGERGCDEFYDVDVELLDGLKGGEYDFWLEFVVGLIDRIEASR